MSRRLYTGISIFMVLLPAAFQASADTVTETRGYNYSEDWAVVSAPPPPGPYRAVNLDPRIPGTGMLPFLPIQEPVTAVVSEEPANSIPAEALQNPPAAGMPVMSQTGRSPADDLSVTGSVMPPPVPGRYNRAMTNYEYPAAPRYPVRTGYPGYRNMPPMGYYDAQPPHAQQQVPPPPVYDAMMNDRQNYTSPEGERAP